MKYLYKQRKVGIAEINCVWTVATLRTWPTHCWKTPESVKVQKGTVNTNRDWELGWSDSAWSVFDLSAGQLKAAHLEGKRNTNYDMNDAMQYEMLF